MSGVYRATPQMIARSAIVAAALAIAIGVAWAYQPAWSFWFAVGGAFVIAETMFRVNGAKRGNTYQIIGMAAVLGCVVVCRVILVHRLGLSLGDIDAILNSSRIDSPRSRALFSVLALDIPNLVYIGLALAIPYVRFR